MNRYAVDLLAVLAVSVVMSFSGNSKAHAQVAAN